MAQQTINIGTTANDGTGDPLRSAFDKINDNFTELYNDESTAEVNSITAGDGLIGDSTTGDVTLDIVGGDGITANADEIEVSVDDSTIELSASDGSGVVRIKDDGVTYAKMGAEFTTAAAISASDVDFSSAAVFTKTLSANTTLTFSNVSTGMVKDLVITGDFTLTLPASVKTITGTYDGTVSNLIQIVSTNGSTEQWATISQEA